jgi:glycosyltransferase involved in cell wall biosynthesis
MIGLSPSISVVVAVRNGADTIEQCITSFIEQTYPHKEMIVIDGCSTDGTTTIVEKYSSHLAYWVSEPDDGIYSAWNKGLRAATGDWITFLGADDKFWNASVLHSIAPALVKAQRLQWRVVYGSISRIDKSGAQVSLRTSPWELARSEFRNHMSIPHPGLMHHRSLFEIHGAFDESFKICGDYELLLRELLVNEAMFVPNLIVVAVGVNGISNDPRWKALARQESKRALEMHGMKSKAQLSWSRLRGDVGELLFRLFGKSTFDTARSLYWRLLRLIGRSS